MKETGDSCDIRAVIKFAGAFIAWIIGSGFATGQEILQFFPVMDTAAMVWYC